MLLLACASRVVDDSSTVHYADVGLQPLQLMTVEVEQPEPSHEENAYDNVGTGRPIPTY